MVALTDGRALLVEPFYRSQSVLSPPPPYWSQQHAVVAVLTKLRCKPVLPEIPSKAIGVKQVTSHAVMRWQYDVMLKAAACYAAAASVWTVFWGSDRLPRLDGYWGVQKAAVAYGYGRVEVEGSWSIDLLVS